jgi:hypothetical protein
VIVGLVDKSALVRLGDSPHADGRASPRSRCWRSGDTDETLYVEAVKSGLP